MKIQTSFPVLLHKSLSSNLSSSICSEKNMSSEIQIGRGREESERGREPGERKGEIKECERRGKEGGSKSEKGNTGIIIITVCLPMIRR